MNGDLVDSSWLDDWRATLVVAPHPDDESIGCGGLIAMLRERGVAVSVVLVSDGTMSHPNSIAWPPARRRALRVQEMRSALTVLAVQDAGALHELGYPDGQVPGLGNAGFKNASCALLERLAASGASVVVAPWRRDPHPDHRAASELTRHAIDMLTETSGDKAQLVKYTVWADERGGSEDLPRGDESLRRVQLDITSAVAQKTRALAEHRSQLGGVIKDDPRGFVLP